jgi:hypothetical protein
MSGLTGQMQRLTEALDRLETALVAYEERSRANLIAETERAKADAVTEIEAELRDEAAAVTARVTQVIDRIETLLRR